MQMELVLSALRDALVAAQPSTAASTEMLSAQLLLSGGMSCLTTESPSVFSGCGSKAEGFLQPQFTKEDTLRTLAAVRVPDVLKPPPKC
jgi:hypothetical protein